MAHQAMPGMLRRRRDRALQAGDQKSSRGWSAGQDTFRYLSRWPGAKHDS